MQPAEPKSLTDSASSAFAESVALMARLRGPGGCPWDREQTLATIRKYTLEEVYEVIDAIDREHWDDLREELGDLQLQVLFYAQIAADEGRFTISDVLETLNRKLVRRHPHVFGEAAAAAAGNNVSLGKRRQHQHRCCAIGTRSNRRKREAAAARWRTCRGHFRRF